MNPFLLHERMLASLILCKRPWLLWDPEYPEDTVLVWPSSTSSSYSLLPLAWWSLRRGVIEKASEHFTDIYSLYLLCTSCDFLLVTIHYTKKLCRWGVRTALNLLVETCKFRGHLILYPLSRNDNKRYTSWAYALPNHVFMAKFTVPDMCFLLWWPQIQSESGWLPP